MTPLAINKVLTDTRLLGATLGDITTWSVWLIVLRAAFGHPLDAGELETFHKVAGNRGPPGKRCRELWCVVSRRGGKSRIASALAVFLALFQKHRLAGGEVGYVLVLAATVDQAKVVFNYVLAFLQKSPVLRNEIVSTTRSEIRLKNGIVIAVHPNNFRSVRGRTLCGVIFDESAFWRDDSTATPDTEVYSAVLPALLTTNGMLIGISSPYRRMGLLHSKFKQHYGVDGDDVLVVKGASKVFNPTLDEAAITAQRLADPTAARSEWDSDFRIDISGFLDEELIDAAIDRDRPLELPPRPGVFYKAYCDASGGAVGGDAYCIAIAHRERGRFVVDLVRGRQGPFEPVELTKVYSALCKQYFCHGATGDSYSAEWVASAWRACGVSYTPATLTASETYIECLPLFARALVSLPPHPILERELRLLERTPTRMGKDQVVHPRGCHDDYANVVCGCLRSLSNYLGYDLQLLAGAFSDWDDNAEEVSFQEQERERRYAELMARYGGPVSLGVPEYREATREDVPEQVREAFARARLDALRRTSSSLAADNVGRDKP
jgi:hypothetical protein